MVTARQPWYSRHNSDGTVEIFDGDGDRVALLHDHRDADLIIRCINDRTGFNNIVMKAIRMLDKYQAADAKRELESLVY